MKPSVSLLILIITAQVISSFSVATPDVQQRMMRKNIAINVESEWQSTSLINEALEYFSEDQFWDFVDALSDNEAITDKAPYLHNDKSSFDILQTAAHSILKGDLEKSVFNVSIATRALSPSVELHRQRFQMLSQDKNSVEANAKCAASQDSWINVNGVYAECDPQNIDIDSIKHALKDKSSPTHLLMKGIDHVFPSENAHVIKPVLILYSSAVGSQTFNKFHSLLKSLATNGHIVYALRILDLIDNQPFNLQSYGVELAIKSTEYNVIDDSLKPSKSDSSDKNQQITHQVNKKSKVHGIDFSKLVAAHPDQKSQLNEFRDHLLAQGFADNKLQVWQLQDLGFQAAQVIMASQDPIASMEEISQNFPQLAFSLAHLEIDAAAKTKFKQYQQHYMGAGRNHILVNGRTLEEDSTTVFSVLSKLREDMRIVNGITKQGIPGSKVSSFFPRHFNVHYSPRIDVRSKAVKFINNLETDPQYRQWPATVRELLAPSYGGQIKFIRKNLYNVVVALDPASQVGLKMITAIYRFWRNQAPTRFGIVFLTKSTKDLAAQVNPNTATEQKQDSDILPEEIEVSSDQTDAVEQERQRMLNLAANVSERTARLYYYLFDNMGATAAMNFLMQCSNALTSSGASSLSLDHLSAAFHQIIGTMGRLSHRNAFDEIFSNKEIADTMMANDRFLFEKGITRGPVMFVNGKMKFGESALDSLVQVVYHEAAELRQHVQSGKLNDNSNIYDFIMKQQEVVPRFNSEILGSSKLFFDLTNDDAVALTTKFSWLSNGKGVRYPKFASLWLVADLTSRHGLDMLATALRFLISEKGESHGYRLAIVHNGPLDKSNTDSNSPFSHLNLEPRIIDQLAQRLANMPTANKDNINQALNHLLAVVQQLASLGARRGSPDALAHILHVKGGIPESVLKHLESKQAFDADVSKLLRGQAYLAQHDSIDDKWSGIVVNGRAMKIDPAAFVLGDLDLLEYSDVLNVGRSVYGQLDDITFEGVDPDDQTIQYRSEVLMRLVSILTADSVKQNRASLPHALFADGSGVSYVHQGTGGVTVQAIINPLSPFAQKMTTIIRLLRDDFGASLRIAFNPQGELTEMPLKSFYRYSIQSKAMFDSKDKLTPGPWTVFDQLPVKNVLTLNVKAPESWLIASKDADFDMDNIKLEDLGSHEKTMFATYRLQNLVVTGQCYEDQGEAPRGLEVTLGDHHDTIVMSNLGYFQLKSSPGVWPLRLKEGRGRKLYHISAVTNQHGVQTNPLNDFESFIAVTGFDGTSVQLRVQKRPGMEKHTMLGDTDLDGADKAAGGIFSSIFGSSATPEPKSDDANPTGVASKKKKNADINIFSIASGHLYERFLKIMMLSVIKNTKSTVKFWFLGNYLSPQFKKFMPKMAKKYGIEFEFVTYKWPSWLHKQTEKQRLIWAYKVLFLDVLFPIDLDKIIFVDADQVVRTDMQELIDLNLQGRAVGYTPFCSSRKEIEGFRFWKQGFWQQHLRGRPYHISALYVVDLKRFRKTGAGDQYRITYDSLSKDPNSLSNLDQDLPNYLQHMVPIHSLPQEWLWCETWCSDESKKRAKTIDLCNNPMTKVPKLEAARKIIPEWVSYDEEWRTVE